MTRWSWVAAGVMLLSSAPIEAQTEWRSAHPDYAWSFPRDHWAHPDYRTEWWYFTGVLADTADPNRRFGYQFTFFRVGLSPDTLAYRSAWATRSLIMGHAAVTDLSTGRHTFSEVLYRPTGFLGAFGEPGNPLIAWSAAPTGTHGRWTLEWNGSAFDLSYGDDVQGTEVRLSTTPTKPLVFQGPNGFSRKGDGETAASLYYSFTRLETSGTVTMDGDTVTVLGESWMDKEFGSNQLGEHQVGWDWFSLRLDDGRDIMLYLLRSDDGIDYARGTVVSPTGAARYLDRDALAITSIRSWSSPETGARYPSGWTLELPDEDVDVEIVPLVAGQENVARLVPDLFYWEGAVEIRTRAGSRVGEGYVELTGYGTRTRPAI